MSIVLFGFTPEPSSAAFLAVMQGLATAAGTTAESALGGRGFLIDAPGKAAVLSIAGSAGTQQIYLLVTGTDPAIVEEVARGALDDLR